MPELDEFFDAYDRAHTVGAEAPDWKTLRKHVRQRLLRPVLKLGLVIAAFAITVALGATINRWFFMIALCVAYYGITHIWVALRAEQRALRDLSSSEDLRKYLNDEGEKRRIIALLHTLLSIALVWLSGLAAGITALLDENWTTPLAACGVIFLWGIYEWTFGFQKNDEIPTPTTLLKLRADGETDESEDDDDESWTRLFVTFFLPFILGAIGITVGFFGLPWRPWIIGSVAAFAWGIVELVRFVMSARGEDDDEEDEDDEHDEDDEVDNKDLARLGLMLIFLFALNLGAIGLIVGLFDLSWRPWIIGSVAVFAWGVFRLVRFLVSGKN